MNIEPYKGLPEDYGYTEPIESKPHWFQDKDRYIDFLEEKSIFSTAELLVNEGVCSSEWFEILNDEVDIDDICLAVWKTKNPDSNIPISIEELWRFTEDIIGKHDDYKEEMNALFLYLEVYFENKAKTK